MRGQGRYGRRVLCIEVTGSIASTMTIARDSVSDRGDGIVLLDNAVTGNAGRGQGLRRWNGKLSHAARHQGQCWRPARERRTVPPGCAVLVGAALVIAP